MSETPAAPDRPDATAETRIGVDTWVAEAEGRRERGWAASLRRSWDATPASVKLLLFIGVAATLPYWMNEGDLFSYGLYTLLYVLLALGLNVVVGFAGLLDLGYVAFFGFGAYAYALFSSNHYGLHWPAEATIPVVMLGTAVVGLILGSTSRRLLGDYLAIVTLFFGQAFVAFVNNANPKVAGVGLTGGSNGIPNLDPLNFFGYKLHSTKQYFFLLVIVFSLVSTAIYFVSQSRTGRAWRALREDPLAAEVMSVPVNRLKLLAFVFGAAIAGNFTVDVLITLYAIVILGGLGSIAGVVLGGIVINVSFQFLAPSNDHPELKRWLFYFVLVLLVALIRPWYRALFVIMGTAAFGFAVHAIADAVAPSWTSGVVQDPGSTGKHIADWVIVIPSRHDSADTYLYIALVVAVVCLRFVKGWWRAAGLIPTLYLTAVVWENVLVEQPAVTRLILFGALLVALMTARPQGLLGTARVEIV
jgi:ABC-type branched-subunit amino acid transport system permease subunit